MFEEICYEQEIDLQIERFILIQSISGLIVSSRLVTSNRVPQSRSNNNADIKFQLTRTNLFLVGFSCVVQPKHSKGNLMKLNQFWVGLHIPSINMQFISFLYSFTHINLLDLTFQLSSFFKIYHTHTK